MRKPVLAPLRRLALRFRRDSRGIAAVEFALILPLMAFIYLGALDTTMIVTADRRVTTIASSIGDLVSQATQITPAEMDDIFAAASTIIEPMPVANLSIVVTSVIADEDGNTTIGWSRAHHGSAGTAGAAFTLPEGIVEPNGSVIVSTVSYAYASPVAQFLTGGTVNLDEVFYLRPRRSNEVAFIN